MFSGKKKKKDGPPVPKIVVKTGGHVDKIVVALLVHAFDADEQVRVSIAHSLREVGMHQTVLFLTQTVDYINGANPDHGHRVALLRIMGEIIEERRNEIPDALAPKLVEFACKQMIVKKEVQADWQGASSKILVELCVAFPDPVLSALIKQYPPGQVPHYYVIKTLSDVAAANPISFTLQLSDVLERVVPVLGGIKKDPTRWIFTTALGNFAQAVNSFVADAGDEEKALASVDDFRSPFASAFMVIFENWRNSKETKVRLAIAESLGRVASVMDIGRFKASLPNLLPAFLAMYKKEKFLDHLAITEGLHATVEVMIEDESYTTGFENFNETMNRLLQVIHPLASRVPDYQNPQTVKNHNVMLRIFELIGRTYRGPVFTYIYNRLQDPSPEARLGSLLILRHLVNSLDQHLGEEKARLLASVQVLMKEGDLRVKKSFIQLIIGMADNGYLTLEGGQNMVTFILRQCAISEQTIAQYDEKKQDPKRAGTTPAQLRNAGDHIMTILCTKVPSTHPVLWPFLFEFVCNPPYSPGLSTICKAIAHLGYLKIESKQADFRIDWEQEVNLPSAQAVYCRMMVMLNVPFTRKGWGTEILQCLGIVSPVIHSAIGGLYRDHVGALKRFVQEGEQDKKAFNQTKWEDTLLRLFKESAGQIHDEQWIMELGNTLVDHWKFYPNSPQLKRSIHRYLGTVLHRAKKKDFIVQKIDEMLDKTNHEKDLERQGCAQGLGLTSQSHFDAVLERLVTSLQRLAPVKKKSFFSFGADKQQANAGYVKCTIVLAWGYSVAYAPNSLVVSRIEAHVLNHLLPIVHKAKNPQLREAIIKSTDLIAKSVHPIRLQSHYILKERDALIKGMLAYIKEGALKHKVIAINSVSALVNLQPALVKGNEVRRQILDVCLPHLNMADDEKNKEDVQTILQNLNNVLASLVHMETTVDGLGELLQRLEFWTVSKKPQERLSAVVGYLVLLKKFMSRLTADATPQDTDHLDHLGHFLAFMIPRCMDSTPKIRLVAIENVQALLYIDQLLRDRTNTTPSQELKMFTPLKNVMNKAETRERRIEIVGEMANILAAALKTNELPEFLNDLLKGINDPDEDAALGTTQILQGMVLNRNMELKDHVGSIVDECLVSVATLDEKNDDVLQETLKGIVTLSEAHFDDVVQQLFEHSHPVKPEVTKIFNALGNSEELHVMILEHLLHVVNDTPLVEGKQTPDIMVAICALTTVLRLDRIRQIIPKYYPPVFGALLARIGTAYGVDDGTSTRESVECFKAFLESASEEKMLEDLNGMNAWEQFSTPRYEDGAHSVTEVLCAVNPARKRSIFNAMVPFLSKHYVGQRTMASAVIAEFVLRSAADIAVVQQAIRQLLPRVTDKDDRVRLQGLIGLGNLMDVWTQELEASGSSVLSALTMAMEDQIDEVAAEAVSSLTKVLSVVSDDIVSPMLINICFRMRPAFDRREPSIRKAAFGLFAGLCKFGHGVSAENFEDQVHTNLPTYVVHLNDDDEEVSKACLESFKKVAELVDIEELTGLLQEYNAQPHEFDGFVRKFCPIFTENFPRRLTAYLQAATGYFKSNWPVIRGNAAMFAGHLIASVPERRRRTVDLGSVINEILQLLKAPNANVRARAAKVLSYLYEL